MASTFADATRLPDIPSEGWLLGRRFDVSVLIASAAIVPIVLGATWLGASDDAVNLGVTALVGGPHVFATFTSPILANEYRRRHPVRVAFAWLIPPLVVYMAVRHYQTLLSCFLLWASFHVLHQTTYLSDCYERHAGRASSRFGRFLDHAVVLGSIYPLALYKL